MSAFDVVRPYFRTRMNSLGYTEWTDGFNFENIPQTIFDRAYHVASQRVDAVSQSQQGLQTDQEVVLRVFFKAFRNVNEGIDLALSSLEGIVREILLASNRTTGTQGLRNVVLRSVDLEPALDENDNTIKLTLTFNCQVWLDICI